MVVTAEVPGQTDQTAIDLNNSLYIHPSDNLGAMLEPISFSGIGYRSWREVLRSLSVKNNLGFTNGKCALPKPDDSKRAPDLQFLSPCYLAFDCFALLLDFLFPYPILQKGFGMYVELEDDSVELAHASVGKMKVEHKVGHYTLDMEVGEWDIMDSGKDSVKLWHKLGFEPVGNDGVVLLPMPVVQLQWQMYLPHSSFLPYFPNLYEFLE
ncbi:hypothetical protein CQW23_23430 [Capsicum baccatum]|uniref:Retrotransposon Copia-like N-terminal domain-containing protein n=1 Tax=Capsicum baccatum TaxID=33114 RepID=A0A2G2VRX9_CAPBA|nr:hypothetical protein CQW23_23430 [Capsicum baccatum]